MAEKVNQEIIISKNATFNTPIWYEDMFDHRSYADNLSSWVRIPFKSDFFFFSGLNFTTA